MKELIALMPLKTCKECEIEALILMTILNNDEDEEQPTKLALGQHISKQEYKYKQG